MKFGLVRYERSECLNKTPFFSRKILDVALHLFVDMLLYAERKDVEKKELFIEVFIDVETTFE